ncbi:S-adenosyl-L-methionine-dependent methyltransferase [Hyaloscypha variabilis F]|uniref:S-adenosyl-L-methionine-dependent methyltransferase n=1 Tax=Hyaloscypha variabilis (strain UAMH 11265 / GT02V1 / F) TaxID=1149755 RepID=A0A2J6RU53_HYAVF|nr:S-adenosyl-L-methionine-dependent methyltransferase [Hyaloscypha variabilis F]
MSSDLEPVALKHINAAAASIANDGSSLDEETRKKTLNAVRELVKSLEKPFEVLWRYSYRLSSQRMAMRVGLDMGLYDVLVKADGKPVKAQELADACKAEKLFTVRIMRVLTAAGFVDEVGVETYAANELTKLMAEDVTDGVVKGSYDMPARVQVVMHNYFRERGYKSPVDPVDGPMQWTLNTKLAYFEYVQQDPELFKAFTQLMTRWRGLSKHWTEWYPVQANILDGASTNAEEIIMVDMGGDRGHDLEIFLKRFPSTQGRLVLQDLPMTIATVPHLAPAIKTTVHDFFTPQPVKGARVYFMHIILHDWPDDKVRDIFRQIIPAMRPGYSKLLLNEIVLPDQKCPADFAAADINMMNLLAGMERSRAQWIELVESVGLKVIAVHTSPFMENSEGVVEAMLEA